VNEQIEAFDSAVKRRLIAGETPEEAVSHAEEESGLKLPPMNKQQLVHVLELAQVKARDPEFIAKRNALERRIRELCKAGMTIQKAVSRAQDDTGVRLEEKGQKMLVEVLEHESERLGKIDIAPVSDEEFARMQADARCTAVTTQGLDAWHCCACAKTGRGTVNSALRRACHTCNHARCDLQ
jgi:hypothetical protein